MEHIVNFLAHQSPTAVDPNWLRQRLAYATFIWPEARLFYMETPKAACSTIKWRLAELAGGPPTLRPVAGETSLEMAIHDRSQHPLPSLLTVSPRMAQAALTSPDWTRFCVVRNPYSRIASAWAEKIRELSPRYRALACEIVAADPEATENRSASFAAFVHYLTASACAKIRGDPHWAPMSDLLLPKAIAYTHVLRLEDFPHALDELLARAADTAGMPSVAANRRVNVSLPYNWRQLYDETSAAEARALAGSDFAAFSYDPESWLAAPEAPPSPAWAESAALSAVQARNELIDALWARLTELEGKLRKKEDR